LFVLEVIEFALSIFYEIVRYRSDVAEMGVF